MAHLKGKNAIVTGAARGIGKAIAADLAAHGANVAICDIMEEEVAATAAELGSEYAVNAKGYKVDVSDSAEVDGFVSEVNNGFGSIDVLVNNAGITRDNLLIRMKDIDFDLVQKVNLYGTFYFCRAVGRIMAKQRSGSIINVASIIGLIGNPGQVNYAASKAAIIALTKSVAKELALRGVRCNAVAPGFVETAMTAELDEEVREQYMKLIPLGRFAVPEDIAKTVSFLAGEDSAYITGQVLTVDGGIVME
jgi:3-oxoacyl-[acyl-carrier protein] reductase